MIVTIIATDRRKRVKEFVHEFTIRALAHEWIKLQTSYLLYRYDSINITVS